MCSHDLKACFAEFLGTLAFVFAASAAAAADGTAGIGTLAVAFVHGFAFTAAIGATVATSGGHLNPATTFAAVVTRRIGALTGLGYILSQCLGAAFGAGLVHLSIPAETLAAVQGGTPAVDPSVPPGMAVLLELLLTAFVVFVVFATQFARDRVPQSGVVVGIAIAVVVLIARHLTGPGVNPALHLGPALIHGGLEHAWIYWVGPLLGAGVSGLIYVYGLDD